VGNNGVKIDHENQIGDVLNDYFVIVGKNIEYNFKLKGYEEKSWTELNNNCDIFNSIFVTLVNRYKI